MGDGSQLPPLEGTMNFTVDGARQKPGMLGIGGVLFNSRGEVLMLSKNIGIKDYNKAEVMAILKVVRMFV